ncbi:MAG TPA: hypothetical protein VFL19_06690 [Nitrospira sp.]|nr:hypothetical protein [Nitrospira sp.]
MHLPVFTLVFMLVSLDVMAVHAQPSSAHPSSLPVTPLSPSFDPAEIGSCELCRPLEGRPGSDLQRHRRPRDPQLHPNKKARGMTKSLKRSFKSQLPHRKLDDKQDEPEG